MKKRNTNKKKGFTLIELVVVIAIIGILAAVITPRVRLSLYKARDSRAVASLDALRTASNVYFAEKGTSFNSVAGSTQMTVGMVKKLSGAGYLDAQSEKKLVNSATTTDDAGVVLIEAGMVGACTGETPNLATGKLRVWVETDNVGLKFYPQTGNNELTTEVDTNCKLWNEK